MSPPFLDWNRNRIAQLRVGFYIRPECSVRSSQYSVRSTQFAVLSSQYSVPFCHPGFSPGSRRSKWHIPYSVLSSQFAVLDTKCSVLSSQFYLSYWIKSRIQKIGGLCVSKGMFFSFGARRTFFRYSKNVKDFCAPIRHPERIRPFPSSRPP